MGKERGKQAARLKTAVQTGKFRSSSGSYWRSRKEKGKETYVGDTGNRRIWRPMVCGERKFWDTPGDDLTTVRAGGCGNFATAIYGEELGWAGWRCRRHYACPRSHLWQWVTLPGAFCLIHFPQSVLRLRLPGKPSQCPLVSLQRWELCHLLASSYSEVSYYRKLFCAECICMVFCWVQTINIWINNHGTSKISKQQRDLQRGEGDVYSPKGVGVIKKQNFSFRESCRNSLIFILATNTLFFFWSQTTL